MKFCAKSMLYIYIYCINKTGIYSCLKSQFNFNISLTEKIDRIMVTLNYFLLKPFLFVYVLFQTILSWINNRDFKTSYKTLLAYRLIKQNVVLADEEVMVSNLQVRKKLSCLPQTFVFFQKVYGVIYTSDLYEMLATARIDFNVIEHSTDFVTQFITNHNQ